jgi:hypothetical protein
MFLKHRIEPRRPDLYTLKGRNKFNKNPQYSKYKPLRIPSPDFYHPKKYGKRKDCVRSYLKDKGKLLLIDPSTGEYVEKPLYEEDKIFKFSEDKSSMAGFDERGFEYDYYKENQIYYLDDNESDDYEIETAQKKLEKDLFLALIQYKMSGSKIQAFLDENVVQDHQGVQLPHLDLRQRVPLIESYLLNKKN